MSHPQGTVNNKDVEKYLGLFSECSHTNETEKTKVRVKHTLQKRKQKHQLH